MILSHETLLESIGSKIIVYPLNIEKISRSNVGVTCGKWAWSLSSKENIYKEHNGVGVLTIPANDRALIISEEIIGIDSSLTCNIFTKTSNAVLGLTYVNGLIDPGYIGKLIFQIENYSDKPIELVRGRDTIAMITFAQLDRPTEKKYTLRSSHSAFLRKLDIDLPDEYLSEVDIKFQDFDSLGELLKKSMQYKKLVETLNRRKDEQKSIQEKQPTYRIKHFFQKSWYLFLLLILSICIAFTPIQDEVKIFLGPSIALVGLIINSLKNEK